MILLIMLSCSFPLENAVVYQALDYKLDRLRILAFSSPGYFQSGSEVEVDALVLGPEGQITSGSWITCGLDSETWLYVYNMDCVIEDDLVFSIGEGIPLKWSVPDLRPECDVSPVLCYHVLPFVLKAGSDEDYVSAGFYREVYSKESDIHSDSEVDLAKIPLELNISRPKDGIVDLTAWLGLELSWGRFRWYVDDGVLLDTGRTAVHGVENGRSYSTNRWVLPTEPGDYRIVVVVGSTDIAELPDSGTFDTSNPSFYSDLYGSRWLIEQITIGGAK